MDRYWDKDTSKFFARLENLFIEESRIEYKTQEIHGSEVEVIVKASINTADIPTERLVASSGGSWKHWTGKRFTCPSISKGK